MHRCHCRLNYFGFLFSTADGTDATTRSYWNWKHTDRDRHVILTNYFDLEIFLRSRHLSGGVRCSSPLADALLHRGCISLFLFRGSSKLPNFTHSSNNRARREKRRGMLKPPFDFPLKEASALSLPLSPRATTATEGEREEETKTKHLNDGKMSTDSGGICLLW